MKNENFKQWRENLGITQSEAAKLLGLGRSTIIQYEQGYRRGANKAQVEIPKSIALACAALSAGLEPLS